MGAILSNTETFLAFIEFMLCYHAWCHYSHQLPKELQEHYALIDFASRMVIQFFSSILYRGNHSIDADTCKIHTQLHNQRTHAYFGDLMQYNTVMGEQGSKVWAKHMSQMVVKHGRDKFTLCTSMRVGETMLLDTIMDCLSTQMEHEEKDKQNKKPRVSRQRIPHFHYKRIGTANTLISLDQKGWEQPPMKKWGASRARYWKASMTWKRAPAIKNSLTFGVRPS